MARKKGKGRAVKRARQKFGAHYENEEVKLAPHSMVIHRGIVDKDIRMLIQDVRRVMEPFTALDLKANKRNSLKDFVSIAGPLHVTHLLTFSQTPLNDHMKIVRLPRGPTIHFNLIEYSLRNDVLALIKKKQTHQKQYMHQPLLILNGFTSAAANAGGGVDAHLKLLTATLQNMFPSINVTKVKLNELRRCVLFNYNKEDNTIDFRQYNIRLKPVGLSRPVKKLNEDRLPDLSMYQDISELIERGGNFSESEGEFDGPENQVEINNDRKLQGLAANSASAASSSSTSAIRLSEIGPRLKLKLVKIEEGICEGNVLYHDLIKETPEQLEIIRQSLKDKKKQEKEKKKAKRASAKKKNANDEEREKKSAPNKRKKKADDENKDEDDGAADGGDEADEDAEYYKQELGEEPSPEFFKKAKPMKRKRNEADGFLKGLNIEGLDDSVKNGKGKKDGADEDDDNEDETRRPSGAKKTKKMVKFEASSSPAVQHKMTRAKFLGFSKKKRENLK